MIDTYLAARDELIAQLMTARTAWETFLAYAPTVIVQGIGEPWKQPTDKLWMRFSQQTVIEPQATLAGNDLKRRYTTEGLVFIQIFSPKNPTTEYDKALNVAQLVKNAYRGKESENCIWFRNTRIQELPPEEAWNRINVVSEYTYDQIG